MAGCSCGGGPVLPKTIRREWLQELTAQTQLNTSEVKALYARFRRLAPSGYLLPEQFKQTMGVLGLSDDPFLAEHMFRVFDSSGDGQLSFHEFVAALAIMIRGTEDQKLQLSFDMAAGKCAAESLSLEDFKKLIRACRGLTSSLVATADDTSEKDMERLFYEIVGGGADAAPVMTLEMYKAAVQHEEFLMALGIVHRGGSAPRRKSIISTAGHSPPASRTHSRSQEKDTVLVPFVQIADLRSRLDRVEELLQQKVNEASKTEKYEDTQIVASDQSPIRRPSSPPVNLVSAAVADAWQDLAKFIEEWDVIRGKGSATGLRGASEASLHTTVPGFEREDGEVSREASRAVSRMSSRLSDGAEPLWRKQETMQVAVCVKVIRLKGGDVDGEPNITFETYSGEITGKNVNVIGGATGTGKTSLIYILAGGMQTEPKLQSDTKCPTIYILEVNGSEVAVLDMAGLCDTDAEANKVPEMQDLLVNAVAATIQRFRLCGSQQSS
eukprot:s2312_g2.t1